MSSIINLIKWALIAIGAIATYYMVTLQVQYGVTSKVISEMITPTLHKDAMEKVYMPMTNTLLDTGDITMASIVRIKVAADVSNTDVEEAMASIATAEGIRDVGKLPLSEMVKLQTGKDQRFLKIFQYCSPRTAMIMVDHSDAFSAYLPCRIALIEDKSGQRWLYTLDMNAMIYGGAPLPDNLLKKALEVKRIITAIQKGGAEGDF
ncbi:hypothetical protein SPBRAN_1023 [uncultured Candidatus Thioglobus sp.]|nr:hypothetical protein SPBRAN_1023 [uncultured Candidatus Thioglobus sp.]